MVKYRVIDLFAGCGGLTQGFTDTGRFVPVAAVELDHLAAATYAQNFGKHVHVGDIADWVGGTIPEAEVVVGGPPCQGFSALGKQDPNDPRNTMWRHYVETLKRALPTFFVLENVPSVPQVRRVRGISARDQQERHAVAIRTRTIHSQRCQLRRCAEPPARSRHRS